MDQFQFLIENSMKVQITRHGDFYDVSAEWSDSSTAFELHDAIAEEAMNALFDLANKRNHVTGPR